MSESAARMQSRLDEHDIHRSIALTQQMHGRACAREPAAYDDHPISVEHAGGSSTLRRAPAIAGYSIDRTNPDPEAMP